MRLTRSTPKRIKRFRKAGRSDPRRGCSARYPCVHPGGEHTTWHHALQHFKAKRAATVADQAWAAEDDAYDPYVCDCRWCAAQHDAEEPDDPDLITDPELRAMHLAWALAVDPYERDARQRAYQAAVRAARVERQRVVVEEREASRVLLGDALRRAA